MTCALSLRCFNTMLYILGNLLVVCTCPTGQLRLRFDLQISDSELHEHLSLHIGMEFLKIANIALIVDRAVIMDSTSLKGQVA